MEPSAATVQSRLAHESRLLQVEAAELRAKLAQVTATAQASQQSLQALVVEKGQLLQRLQAAKVLVEARDAELRQLRERCRGLGQLDSLEAQLREEAEARGRLQAEAQEGEKYRSKYNELRRELALVHSEYEQKLAAQAKAADLHAIEAEDRIRHLEQMVADLESRLDDRSCARTVKLLQLEKQELEDRLRALLGELESQREVGEKTTVSLVDTERRNVTRVTDLERLSRTLQGENQRLTEKVRGLEETRLQTQLEMDRQHAEKLKLEGEAAQLRQQMEGLLHSFKTEKAAIRQAAREREQQLEADQTALEMKVHELTKRMTDTEALYCEAVRQRDDADRSAKAKCAAVKEEAEGRLRLLEREKADMVLERESTKRDNERQLNLQRKQIETLRRDLTVVRAELADEAAQRLALESRCEAVEQQMKWVTAERDEAARALEETRERLEECKRELSGALELRGENDRLRLQLEFATRDGRDLEAERDDLREECAKRLQRLQRTTLGETQALRAKLEKYKAAYEATHASLAKCKQKFAAQQTQSERRGKEWRALAQERGQEVQQLRRQLDLFCSAPLAEDAFGAPGPGKPGPEGSPLLATSFHEPENDSFDCLFRRPHDEMYSRTSPLFRDVAPF